VFLVIQDILKQLTSRKLGQTESETILSLVCTSIMQNRRVSWLKVNHYIELLKQWEINVSKRKQVEEKQTKDRKENRKKM
jgi:hypothetical protein